MIDNTNDPLKAYEIYVPDATSMVERLFLIILTIVLALTIGGALLLKRVKIVEEIHEIPKKVEMIRTKFLMEEQRKAQPVQKAPVKPMVDKEPVDLTKNPVLKQKQDEVVDNEKSLEPVTRRVYGLRRVYSVGLGASGANSDAVIGKVGNTLNKDIDTLKATPNDLKGQLVSITTLTQAPRMLKSVKPEYTKEMLDNKVEGVIKLKILVDADGTVKNAVILNDLGFGAGERAIKAVLACLFEPGKRDEVPVACYLTIAMRFVLLGN